MAKKVRRLPDVSQLAFVIIPLAPAEILAGQLDLVGWALDDAAAWREQLDDDEAAEAYRELAAELERAREELDS